MKGWIPALLAFGLGAALGTECTRRQASAPMLLKPDTLIVRQPAPLEEKELGLELARLRLSENSEHSENPENPDSALVEVPITQAHYATPEAEAWVSGYKPRLDSLRIIRPAVALPAAPRPKRWHVGITAGAAFTPRGVEPCLCVGITYSFFSF